MIADAREPPSVLLGGSHLHRRTSEAADALLSREIKLWGGVIRDNRIAAQ
jgi:hypothetical protein